MAKDYINAYAYGAGDDSVGPLKIAKDDDKTILGWLRDQLGQGRVVEFWTGEKPKDGLPSGLTEKDFEGMDI